MDTKGVYVCWGAFYRCLEFKDEDAIEVVATPDTPHHRKSIDSKLHAGGVIAPSADVGKARLHTCLHTYLHTCT